MPPARVFIVDNYDSFTFNIAQELGELGAEVEVARHDAFTVPELRGLAPDGIVISPGPGTPADAGLSNDVIRAFAGRTPLLGVCLGHQCIGEVYGGRVVRAPELMHGKTSLIHHDGRGVFAGLPQPFDATRYHSLVVEESSVPAELHVTARTANGLIMGLRHRTAAVEGVQFHPESILTTAGMDLLANFLRTLQPSAVTA
jgi:anthranilate synthase component II